MTPRRKLTTVVVTALAPAIWGTTYLVTTELLPPGRPILAAAARSLPAGLLLTALGRRLPPAGWLLRVLLLGMANFAVFFSLLFMAAYRLPGGVAATLGAAQPLIVTLAAAAVLGESPSRKRQLAAATGLAGVALVVIGPSAALDAVGVLAGLGAASSMAFGTLLVQRFGRPAPLVAFAGWQLTAGGIVLLPVALAVEGLPSGLTGRNAVGFGYLFAVGAIAAYLLWFRGVERLGASSATFLGLLAPLVATVLGYVVQGVALSRVQLVGMAVVLGSVAYGATLRRPSAGAATVSPRSAAEVLREHERMDGVGAVLP